jgi:hypothetical protein
VVVLGSLSLGSGVDAQEFAPRQDYSTGSGSRPGRVVAADFDGDGSLDLATSNFSTGDVSLLLNSGNGDFVVQPQTLPIGDAAGDLAAADLDRDGDPDLAVAIYEFGGGVALFENTAAGILVERARISDSDRLGGVTAADLDGDGDIDLATCSDMNSNHVAVSLNDGGFRFSRAAGSPWRIGSNPFAITSCDLNGDGRPDLATANQGSGSVSVLLNLGGGTFAPAVEYRIGASAYDVECADLDGDRHPDLILGAQGAVYVLWNGGNGTFFVASPYSPGGTSVAWGDMDCDEYVDLVVADRIGTVTVLRNVGGRRFSAGDTFTVGADPRAIVVADFGPGAPPRSPFGVDVATANTNSSTVSVVLNEGCRSTEPPFFRRGDVNGDGILSLEDLLSFIHYLVYPDRFPSFYPRDCAGSPNRDVADVNDNEYITVADALYLGVVIAGLAPMRPPVGDGFSGCGSGGDPSTSRRGFDRLNPDYVISASELRIDGDRVVVDLEVTSPAPMYGVAFAFNHSAGWVLEGDASPQVGGTTRIYTRFWNPLDDPIRGTPGASVPLGTLSFTRTEASQSFAIQFLSEWAFESPPNSLPVSIRATVVDDQFADHHPRFVNNLPRLASFLRGNANGDGLVDPSDAIFTATYLFLGTRGPECEDAADANDDGDIDLSDVIYTLVWYSSGGPNPPAPYPECGFDEPSDALSCGQTSFGDVCYN